MTCATCGRDNPAHLTFCQECGQRLGPRIAPPTPPIGLGGAEAYAAAAAQVPRSAGSFGSPNPRADTPAAPVAPIRVDGRPAANERRCRICDTLNAATLRYCTSCGSTIEPPVPAATARPAQPTPSAAPAAPVAPAAPPTPAQPIMAQAIVPIASIDLAPAQSARTCQRCHAVAETSAQFCKFCGTSLPDPSSANANANRDTARPNGTSANGTSAPGRASKEPPADSPAGNNLRPGPLAGAPAPSVSPIGPSPQAAPSTGAAALAAIPLREMRPSRPAPGLVAEPAPPPRAAASPQRGRLVLIAKSGADGPTYPFGDQLDVGRVEGSVIVAEDPYLSPRHVRLVWSGGKLALRDLGSTNGVYVRLAASRSGSIRSSDGTEISIPLADQDLILIGQQVLRFDILRDNEGGFGPAQEHGTLLFGSPAAPRYARLCQRTVEGITRDVYYIRKVETVLGRESGDVVFTEDPFLSRRHAAIRLLGRDGSTAAPTAERAGSRPPPPMTGGARFALVDLGSSNGTFVRIRSDVELSPGDHFRVGQQLFRVDFDGGRE